MYVQNCVVAILNTEPDVPLDEDNEVNRAEASAQPVDPLLKNVSFFFPRLSKPAQDSDMSVQKQYSSSNQEVIMKYLM